MATKEELKICGKRKEESLMKLINGKMEEIIKNFDVLKTNITV